MTRDFIGYGPTPPDPRWPGGARIAVNFVLNHEEGSEPSYPDGDNVSEWGLTEVAPVNPGVTGRDLAAESMFAYGSRVGVWRILRLFAERNIPLTVFGCALALERNPAGRRRDPGCRPRRVLPRLALGEALRAVRGRGARADRQSRRLDRRDGGGTPAGLVLSLRTSLNTRRLLIEEGGFLYDSDAYDDELPYWTRAHGRPHLVVPYTLSTNDVKFGRGSFAIARRFLHLLPRCVRHAVRRRPHPAENAVDRPAQPHHRPPRPRRRPATAARPHVAPSRRLDHPAHRHRATLGKHPSATACLIRRVRHPNGCTACAPPTDHVIMRDGVA